MKALDIISIVLLLIGGITWGIVGIFDFNFIEYFFQMGSEFHISRHPSVISRIIYILVGASAVYQICQRKAIVNRMK